MRIRLRSKVTGTYIVMIVLIAMLLNIFMVETIKHRMIQIQNNTMMASARVIAAEASNYLDNVNYLTLLATENGRKHNSRILIFNESQVVIADSLQDESILGQRLNYEELQAALKGRSKALTHYLPATKDWVIYASSPINSPAGIKGAILVSSYANDIFGLVYDIRVQIFYLSCLVLVVVSIIGFIFSSNITKPIIKIAEAARRVSKGKLGEQVDINTHDEISYLADVFNDMSTKLANNDNKQRRFFHNASHELKTPLASAILLTDSLVHDYENDIMPPYDFLLDVKEQLYRLQELVTELSVLARLDDKYQIEYEDLSISEVVEQVVVTLKPLLMQKGLILKLTGMADDEYIIKGNSGQIKHALTNIVENAIKYTESGQIEIKLENKASHIIIQVSDTGIGIPDQDLENVFERFYRVDEARTRDKGGSGLGLSIAKEIIESHGGNIIITSRQEKGTRVEIILNAN